jgi:hypothetical protein
MKPYKVIKSPRYEDFYLVYRKTLWFWTEIGSFVCPKLSDKQVLERAKAFAIPKIIYFNA